jgi:hypothetical protein
MLIRAAAPVFGAISFLLKQTPVEVLRHRTAGVDRMRRAEDNDRIAASGGGAGQSFCGFDLQPIGSITLFLRK